MQDHLKNELHDVISGKSQVRFGAVIQSIANYLGYGASSGATAKSKQHVKKQEEARLIAFINERNLWVDDIDFSKFVSEGAEQKVYLKDFEYVVKLNDAIYYLSWIDYFHNLLLHNFFFGDTAYQLIGFTIVDDVLYAAVK